MRAMIEHGLDFRRPALTPADVAHNLAIYKKVHPNSFHCTVSMTRWAHIDSLTQYLLLIRYLKVKRITTRVN
jgi:hypothetical protein